MTFSAYRIEFVGGPVDGHSDFFFDACPRTVAVRTDTLVVETGWLKKLASAFMDCLRERVVPVSVYRACLRGGCWRYEFLYTAFETVRHQTVVTEVVDGTVTMASGLPNCEIGHENALEKKRTISKSL